MIPLMYVLLRIYKVRFDGNTAAGHVGPVRVRGITVRRRDQHRIGHKAKPFNDFPISDCFAALTSLEGQCYQAELTQWFRNGAAFEPLFKLYGDGDRNGVIWPDPVWIYCRE